MSTKFINRLPWGRIVAIGLACTVLASTAVALRIVDAFGPPAGSAVTTVQHEAPPVFVESLPPVPLAEAPDASGSSEIPQLSVAAYGN